jgi:dienelactone hydrolase
VTAADNRALAACKEFKGDVLLVESEQDDYVPHATLMSYRTAFDAAHSLTYRIVDGADHALTSDASQRAYSLMLNNWISEMVIGARLEDYPHHSPTYS